MLSGSSSSLDMLEQPQCEAAINLLSLEARRNLACDGERWQTSLLTSLEHMYNVAAQKGAKRPTTTEPERHRRFDAMMPAVESTCAMSTFGRGDGAKRLCGLEHMPQCVVMSIGSRGDIGLERDVILRTNCTVEIFDCTVPRCIRRRPWTGTMRTGRVRYHRICIGAEDSVTQSSQIRSDWHSNRSASGTFVFRSYASILAKLRLASVAAMKIDIEGFEYQVLSTMLRERSPALPSQLAFELHYSTQMTMLGWRHRERTAGEIALFARDLYDAGYRTLSRADSRRCPDCSEFNVVRLFCPPPRPPTDKMEDGGQHGVMATRSRPGTGWDSLGAADAAVEHESDLWGSNDPGAACAGMSGRSAQQRPPAR